MVQSDGQVRMLRMDDSYVQVCALGNHEKKSNTHIFIACDAYDWFATSEIDGNCVRFFEPDGTQRHSLRVSRSTGIAFDFDGSFLSNTHFGYFRCIPPV